ncbi:MAG TPA: flagella basal body P-ring formation protein FlgA [Acidobacteriaceae bacterium]|jgi:hypothetical protein|nr:flagella basal body P-ring formation protein FlgA [Acidobacteriaceae bacterium]
MRLAGLLFACALTAGQAFAACGGSAPHVLVDWGLHRIWRVELDCLHPAWPAHLVEQPWVKTPRPEKPSPAAPVHREDFPVRAGMRVAVIAVEGDASIHLTGTSLDAGRSGETIRVKAGWDGATLRCVVRGAALAELVKEGN